MTEQVYYREATLDFARADKGRRTVPVAIASEEPYEREFGMEILGMNPKDGDLSRLNNRAPVLRDHNPTKQVGILVPGSVKFGADKVLRGEVYFSTGPEGESELQQVLEGVRTKISLGYKITDRYPAEQRSGRHYVRVKWLGLECSTVAIAADDTVGVGRSAAPTKMKRILHDALATDGGGSGVADHDEIEAIATRMEKHIPGLRDFANRALLSGMSAKEFRERANEMLPRARAVSGALPGNDGLMIGASKRDLDRYSFRKLILEQSEGKLSGLELEFHQEAVRKQRTPAKGAMVPRDVLTYRREVEHDRFVSALLKRDLLAGNFASAGALVDDDFRADAFIDLLRNQMFTAAAGVRTLTGLQGPVVIPKQTGAGTVYWVAEDAEVTETNQTTGQLTMVIHALSAHTDYSKELLIQSSLDIENFIKRDLATTQAVEIDRVIIDGDGTSGEPLGILNTTGLSTAVTFGGAATYAKMIEFETNVSTSNADRGSLAYMTTPATRGKLRAKSVDAGSGVFVWGLDNKVVGYNAFATLQVPGDKVIFGNWGDVYLGIWGGLDVVTDPYTQAKKRLIGVTVSQFVDVAIRNPKSFSVSADTGAA